MLAGLPAYVRSVHELDRAGILELGPKTMLDFGPKIGTYSATCRLVLTAATTAAAALDQATAVELRGACGAGCSHRQHQAACRELYTSFKLNGFYSFGAEADLPRSPQDVGAPSAPSARFARTTLRQGHWRRL